MKVMSVVLSLAAAAWSVHALEVPADPNDACPILMGESLPDFSLNTASGDPFSVSASLRENPAVIVFYRGGWCPYCNAHLADLQRIEKDLLALGYQILAVSPDRPELLTGAGEKNGLHYQLLSDSSMAAARALGIAYEVDQVTVDLYREKYGIDLESDSGETHHQLPIPSVFIVGQDGKILFTYVNPDYKARIKGSLLLEAARSLK